MVAGVAIEIIAELIVIGEVKMTEFLFLPESVDLVGVIEPAVAYRHEDTLALKTRCVQGLEVIEGELGVGIGTRGVRALLALARQALGQV